MAEDYEIEKPLDEKKFSWKLTSQNHALKKSLDSDPNLNLLAHSSKYATTFIVHDKKLKVFQKYSSKWSLKKVAEEDLSVSPENFTPEFTVELDFQPTGVYVTVSSSKIIIVGENGRISVFCPKTLSELSKNSTPDGSDVTSFCCSPTQENDFIYTTTTGMLCSCSITENNSVNLLVGNPGFFSSCVFSPKGKQIAVTLKGKFGFHQYTGCWRSAKKLNSV